MIKRSDDLSDAAIYIIAAEFVARFDFLNSAIMHKSAGSWAKLILDEIENRNSKTKMMEG